MRADALVGLGSGQLGETFEVSGSQTLLDVNTTMEGSTSDAKTVREVSEGRSAMAEFL
jgi:hypothetical protein